MAQSAENGNRVQLIGEVERQVPGLLTGLVTPTFPTKPFLEYMRDLGGGAESTVHSLSIDHYLDARLQTDEINNAYKDAWRPEWRNAGKPAADLDNNNELRERRLGSLISAGTPHHIVVSQETIDRIPLGVRPSALQNMAKVREETNGLVAVQLLPRLRPPSLKRAGHMSILSSRDTDDVPFGPDVNRAAVRSVYGERGTIPDGIIEEHFTEGREMERYLTTYDQAVREAYPVEISEDRFAAQALALLNNPR